VIATDEELVRKARDGDSAAMNDLLGRHYDRVHAVCRRIAGATRDADDAAQETMIRIVRHLDKFDGRSSFGTWVYRIATNTSLDELRKRRRRPQLHVVGDDDAPHELADPMADREVEASVDRSAIDAALAALPEDFRVPLVMRDVADLDYDEIAETLGVPIGTVKSRIARGRRQVVAYLENTGHFGNQSPADRRPTNEAPDLP
jgi:RNA polymerase sigma-70 factor (ECF subfamily)